ncbi:MAG: hypothetical protein PHH73_04810 [Candidatus Rickettsiella isopodorum]|nr:hypothetical protein [Candidatus Rickettsiella isopodorum]
MRISKYRFLGNCGQWISLILALAGIIFMLLNAIDLGTVGVSISSMLWGIATKIKYFRVIKKRKMGVPNGKHSSKIVRQSVS